MKLKPQHELLRISFCLVHVFIACSYIEWYNGLTPKLLNGQVEHALFLFKSALALKVQFSHTCGVFLLHSIQRLIRSNELLLQMNVTFDKFWLSFFPPGSVFCVEFWWFIALCPDPNTRAREEGLVTSCTMSCSKLWNVARPIRSLDITSVRYVQDFSRDYETFF